MPHPKRLSPIQLDSLPLTPPPSDSSPPSTLIIHPHSEQPSSVSPPPSTTTHHHQPIPLPIPARRIHFQAPSTPTTHTNPEFDSLSPSHHSYYPQQQAYHQQQQQQAYHQQQQQQQAYHQQQQQQQQQHHHHHHHHHHSNSNPIHQDWDGTLSASIAHHFNSLRQTLFPRYPTPTSPLIQNLLGSNPSNLSFGFLCALWYSSSALSSNTGKLILNSFKFPVTLTIVQFAFVALWSGLFLILRHHHSSSPSNLTISSLRHHHHRHLGTTTIIQSLGIRIPNRSTIRGTCIMSLFSIAGHVFSSMAISRVPVSTVHTIKALSPLFTVIAYAGLFGVRYRFNTYLSLLPLTLGVMLACSFDTRANGLGFLCALGSTLIFVSQNIFGKKLLPKDSNPSNSTIIGTHRRQSSIGSSSSHHQMDKLNLLFYSSAIAFVMMIPIWFYTDLGTLWTRSELSDPHLPHPSSHPHLLHHSFTPSHPPTQNSIGLMNYFIFNGTVHFAQCILAFSILSRTSPVTYSIASLIKRIAVICIAIIWFGQKLSIVQAFGMILTFAGLYLYNQAKSEIDRGEKRRGQIERRQEIILPSTSNDLEDLSEDQELETFNSYRRDPKVTFENPFRKASLLLTPNSLNLPQASNESFPSSSSSIGSTSSHPTSAATHTRVVNHSITTTRQRAPSIPHASHHQPTILEPIQHHHHHHPFYPPSQHPSPQFNPSTSNPSNSTLKASPLQDSNPYRPVVNVR